MSLHRTTFLQVVAAAALLGFGLGVGAPAWHVALEPAQLLALVVRYPVATPFQLYETQVWNVWHQLLAPLLAAGVSELVLTVALSGVVTALSFAAMAGFAHAVGAGAAFAVAAPLLVLLNQPAQEGFRYPIYILGLGHTYGMAGLAWLGLSLAALAAERWRLGGFLVGLAPALHASLGAWLAIAIGLAALPALRGLRPHLRVLCEGAALGVGLCVLSVGIHLVLSPAAPPVDPATAERYLTAFVRLWDFHRVAPDLAGHASFLAWCSMVTALALLCLERDRLGVGLALALRVLIVCGAVGFSVSIVQPRLVLESVPKLVLIAMPTRLANLTVLLAVPLALAVIFRFRADPLPRVLMLVALGLVALAFHGPVWWKRIDLATTGAPLLGIAAVVALAHSAQRRRTAALITAGLLGWLVLRALWCGLANPAWLGLPGELSLDVACGAFIAAWSFFGRAGSAQGAGQPARPLDVALAAGLAGIAVATASTSISRAGDYWQQLVDWTNHPVLAQAERGSGLLLVGPGLDTVQARTRRPLLLDPSALDMLPYVPSAGPAVEEILRGAYGIEFFHPPGQALAGGLVPDKPVREFFARRTPDEWREVRARFGVSELLVQPDWNLRLPALARGDGYALYALPE